MYVCVIEWVLFLATKKTQDRYAFIIPPPMTSNVSRWHLCLKSRTRASGTSTKKWGRPLWSSVLASCSLIYLSLVLHVLWLCVHSLHQAKIDSIIDIFPRGAWLSIWDGFSKILTWIPEGWNGSKIPHHTIGQHLFFPSLKGVNLTFSLVTKAAIFSYLWLGYKGLWGRAAHRVLFEGCQMVPQDPAGASFLHRAWNVHSYFCWIILLLLTMKSNIKTKLAMPTERERKTLKPASYMTLEKSKPVLQFPHL